MQLRNLWKWKFWSDQSWTFIFWVTQSKNHKDPLGTCNYLTTSKMQKGTAKWAHNPSLCCLLVYMDFQSARESSLKIKFWKGRKQFSNFFKCWIKIRGNPIEIRTLCFEDVFHNTICSYIVKEYPGIPRGSGKLRIPEDNVTSQEVVCMQGRNMPTASKLP